MDPLTHFLTGACVGRAGFNRRTAYATVAAVLAAEAADIDVVMGFAGPVEELSAHRAVTHALVAAPLMAALVVGVVWIYHRGRRACRQRRENRAPSREVPDLPIEDQGASITSGHFTAIPSRKSRFAQPVHWLWLYAAALAAALTHPLLDWTNNYGIRLFYPFSDRWYEGSLMFIVEPELWAILLLALVMPWLLGLTDREIGVRRSPFRGRIWACFGLAAMAALIFWRWGEHDQGLVMLANTQVASEPVQHMALEPYPLNPYRWHALLETKGYYQTAEVDTWDPDSLTAIITDPHTDVIYKPTVTAAVDAARRTFLGRVYLAWGGEWAVVRDVGPMPEKALPPPVLPPGRTWTTVTFNDLRFDYPVLPSQSRNTAPLSGWVYIIDGREEAGEGMGGRMQK